MVTHDLKRHDTFKCKYTLEFYPLKKTAYYYIRLKN